MSTGLRSMRVSLCRLSPLSARVGTILNLIPDLLPFLPPRKRAVTGQTYLSGQVELLVWHLRSQDSRKHGRRY